MVALMAGLARTAIPTKVTASATRRKLTSNCGKRRSTPVASTASSVLPLATATAVHSGAWVAALTAKAATQIAGQSRGPQMSRLAIAIPVGAQTVVTCSATNAARKPISAAATYAIATTAAMRTELTPLR